MRTHYTDCKLWYEGVLYKTFCRWHLLSIQIVVCGLSTTKQPKNFAICTVIKNIYYIKKSLLLLAGFTYYLGIIAKIVQQAYPNVLQFTTKRHSIYFCREKTRSCAFLVKWLLWLEFCWCFTAEAHIGSLTHSLQISKNLHLLITLLDSVQFRCLKNKYLLL